MKQISFGVFTDIHYANPYGSGVTVEDVASVERQFTNLCIERKVDFAIFAGDRFLSHTPDDVSRLHADREQRYRNDSGIVTFSELGNHDWQGKTAHTGHSNRFAKELWPDIHQNLVIMDTPGTYTHDKVPDVRIHALPAGSEFTWDCYKIPGQHSKTGWDILVFHDLLAGTIIDVQSQFKMNTGMNRDSLDHPEFDLVLGGDVHIPQKIEFKFTRGGYIGSCIQQSRRDRGDSRGFVFFTLGERVDHVASITSEFVPSICPHFVDVEWDVGLNNRFPTSQEIEAIVQASYGEGCKGNIVDLVFTGPRLALEKIPTNYAKTMELELQARRVNPPTKVQPVVLTMGSNLTLTKTTSPEQDLDAFVKSGKQNLNGLDLERVLEKGNKVLEQLR